MTTRTRRLQVPVTPLVEQWLAARAAHSPALDARQSTARQAGIELEHWRRVCAAELRVLRLDLDHAVFLGQLVGPLAQAEGQSVYQQTYEMLSSLLPGQALDLAPATRESHGRLLAYLHGLGPAADHALRQALVAWHAAGAEPTEEAFALVGLHVSGDLQDQGGERG